MARIFILLVGLSAAITSSGGCRSCSSCHDYDPPVANCDCNAGGTDRAGSVSGGYVPGDASQSYEENYEAPAMLPDDAGW